MSFGFILTSLNILLEFGEYVLFVFYRCLSQTQVGLPDVFCKNTSHFVNSDRSRLCPKRVCNGTRFLNSILRKKSLF